MPAPTRTTAKKTAPARRRPVKHVQPPIDDMIEPDEESEAVDNLTTHVDGLAVVETHRPQNLPSAPYNLLKLTLEDGTSRYQCIDCPEAIGTREEIRSHRRHFHGTTKKPAQISPAVLSMSVAQLLYSAETSNSYGSLLERVEGERDRYRSELATMTRKYSQLTKALEKIGFAPVIEEDDKVEEK